jgi:hypothetical protein
VEFHLFSMHHLSLFPIISSAHRHQCMSFLQMLEFQDCQKIHEPVAFSAPPPLYLSLTSPHPISRCSPLSINPSIFVYIYAHGRLSVCLLVFPAKLRSRSQRDARRCALSCARLQRMKIIRDKRGNFRQSTFTSASLSLLITSLVGTHGSSPSRAPPRSTIDAIFRPARRHSSARVCGPLPQPPPTHPLSRSLSPSPVPRGSSRGKRVAKTRHEEEKRVRARASCIRRLIGQTLYP